MSEQFNSQPPTAGAADANAPQASTAETLTGIFFEPASTFDALRVRPRFLVAGAIMILLALVVTFLLFSKIDYPQFMREQIEKSPRAEQMTPEQIDRAVGFYTSPIGRMAVYAFPVIGSVVFFAAGAGLYLLGAMAMGGAMRYKQALSVWIYSSLPPAVLGALISVVVLFMKSPDQIDVGKPGAGLIVSNLAFLVGSEASPVIKALLGSIDLLAFYGLFLAAVGMRRVGRMSAGAAWSVVLGLWLLSVVLKVAWAAAFG